jgi:hypothetical protein
VCLAWYIIFRYFTSWVYLICSFKNITLSNLSHNNNSRFCFFVKLLYFCHNDFSIIETSWKKSFINITINMFSKNLFVSRFCDLTIMQLLSILIIIIIIFHTRCVIDLSRLMRELCHEMWLFIILRMRKPCINDRTIAKIMIIREEFYSKDVKWSVLRYNTCSDQSHILIWRWIILIELIWWFQSLSRNSIIIKACNFIINWRLNDSIYLSIKSAVNTYIYHKMMRYWSHTKR